MKNLIVEYQKVYQVVTQRMKEVPDILAAFVFGSMVTGDLWENSDIDFFVILKDSSPGIRNLYSNEQGVPVHLKVLSKAELMAWRELEVRGGYMHRIFSSSKLVFSKDPEITNRYNDARFYPEKDRRKWTLSYLGRLIKSIDSTEKFMYYGNHYGAYHALMESMELFASILVNTRGYLISKDTLNVAAGLDQEFRQHYQLLVSGEQLEEKTKIVNRYLKQRLDKEILEASEVLLAYFREHSRPLSSSEIKADPFFQDFDLHMEGILNLLHRKNLLKQSYRSVKTPEGYLMFEENVYSL